VTPLDGSWVADLLLRGAVGGLLLFHLIHLALPGPRPAARAALAMFTVSLIGYLFCQSTRLMLSLPYALAWLAIALCVGTTAWLWLAARGLFSDDFTLSLPMISAAAALLALGLAAALPRWQAVANGLARPEPSVLTHLHALAMLGFTAAAIWEVARGWRDDLVEPRRALRRWVALGVGGYAGVSLIVELAVRERDVGALLPALHVMAIGLIALALAVLVARKSINSILGLPQDDVDQSAAPAPEQHARAPADAPPKGAAEPVSPSLSALMRAMDEQRLYRREGLTLAQLAQDLNMGEAELRALINQRLGYRNFNDFLHHYRLQEAAARLAAEDLPILTIALESGYGSIGPFNRAFRERFGMTPTEYRAAARMERHRQTN
jgi:AraC-like DNA-binding protein